MPGIPPEVAEQMLPACDGGAASCRCEELLEALTEHNYVEDVYGRLFHVECVGGDDLIAQEVSFGVDEEEVEAQDRLVGIEHDCPGCHTPLIENTHAS